jgi:hypothetical protein
MAETIQGIFCDPPIAIARLGGSSTPLDAYVWDEPANPRTDGDTVVVPAWSLRVAMDGTFESFMPDSIAFRDGEAIRPICPFVELHVWLGEPGSDPSTWREAPLTPDLLAATGVGLDAVALKVSAANLKAARRIGDPDLAYGTAEPVTIAGNMHGFVPLAGVSPRFAARPMIPLDRNIPLGGIQILRPIPMPVTSPAWGGIVDPTVLRFRVTPARGLFYGPPRAARPTVESEVAAVDPANAFLDPDAGWFDRAVNATGFVQPADTYDMVRPESAVEPTPPSLGVIDDTCEIRVVVELILPGANTPLTAHASVFVAPPDFAPDRRPFLSLADELNDRAAARAAPTVGAELDDWVEDLFQRIYETVSLANVDFLRRRRGLTNLSGPRLAPAPIADDRVVPADQAMGSRDALRNPDFAIGEPSSDVRLPLSEHARSRHRTLSGIAELRELALRQPDRLKALIRQPFEVEDGEQTGGRTTMRMPPFMRQSNALPLTLAAWQYDLITRWSAAAAAGPVAAHPAPAVVAAMHARVAASDPEFRKQSDERRAAVLARAALASP